MTQPQREQPRISGNVPAILPHEWTPTHDVHFYASDESMFASVSRFLVAGVKVGQPIVVIATPAHSRAFRKAMLAMGVDAEELVQGRDCVWLDARETLSAFMEGSRPNAELFDATVGSVFEKIMRDRRYVITRAYGEMVDLLWRDGKLDAALELEELWNNLATKYAFTLLCTYSVDSMLRGDCRGIDSICAKHTRVLPGDEAAA